MLLRRVRQFCNILTACLKTKIKEVDKYGRSRTVLFLVSMNDKQARDFYSIVYDAVERR